MKSKPENFFYENMCMYVICTIKRARKLSNNSGVTTMGSDRGPPTPMGQAVEQKHSPGSLICENVVF
jgi:hypothetical protein